MENLPPRVMRLLLSLLARVPFVNGVTLLLLLSERANRESHPPFPPFAIYLQIGLFVLVGSGMSANLRRRDCALLYTAQLGAFALFLLGSSTLAYPSWLVARLVTRTAASAAVFLYLAFLCDPPASPHLRSLARSLLGLVALARGYTLFLADEEKGVLAATLVDFPTLAYLPAAMFTYAGLSMLTPGALLGHRSVRSLGLLGEGQALWVIAGCVICSLVLFESNISVWRTKMQVDLWAHLRLLADDLTTLLGIVIVNNRCTFLA